MRQSQPRSSTLIETFGEPRLAEPTAWPTIAAAGGIADLLVPARDRQLGSKDGGTGLVAIFADLPDFAALVFIQRRHGPVIDHQNINAA